MSVIVELGKRSIRSFIGHGMPTHASALAYQGLFALFPFILFLGVLLVVLQIDLWRGRRTRRDTVRRSCASLHNRDPNQVWSVRLGTPAGRVVAVPYRAVADVPHLRSDARDSARGQHTVLMSNPEPDEGVLMDIRSAVFGQVDRFQE